MTSELEKLRKEIDALDDALIPLLEKRFDLVLRLRPLKPTLTDPVREQEILSKISSPAVQALYHALFQISKQFLL